MKKIIKVLCVDDGNWNKSRMPWFSPALHTRYSFELCDKPDFLFYSCFGTEFLKYSDCVRIFVNGENVRPDFNQCDYAMGFDRLDFGERYLRNAYYAIHYPLDPKTDYSKRRFCNFVYSNPASGEGARERIEFCKFLAKYKRVDCPGAVLNNMAAGSINARYGDKWREGKMAFLRNYKFTIAWENSYYPGYITEKLTQPLMAHSIPIYMGDPDVTLDFNPKAFINCRDFTKWDDILEYVAWLDSDDKAYMAMLAEPPMRPDFKKPDRDAFYINIFERGERFPKVVRENFLYQPFSRQDKFARKIWAFLFPASNDGTSLGPLLDQHLLAGTFDNGGKFENTLEPLLKMRDNAARLCGNREDTGLPEHTQAILACAAERLRIGRINPVRFIANKETAARYRDLLTLLWPHDVAGHAKVRIGENGDGGAVMLDPGNNGLALSLGRKGKGGWELELARRGFRVWQYERRIKAPIQAHENITFVAKSISANLDDETHIPIGDVFSNMGDPRDLIGRIDMEEDEWDLLDAMDSTQLGRFAQFYIEFHGLADPARVERFQRILERILTTHLPVHVHYHNYGPISGFDSFLFPNLLEVTFARRDLGNFSLSRVSYPTNLDAPNVAGIPDVYIGRFSDITGLDSPDQRGVPPEIMKGNLKERFSMRGAARITAAPHAKRPFEPKTFAEAARTFGADWGCALLIGLCQPVCRLEETSRRSADEPCGDQVYDVIFCGSEISSLGMNRDAIDPDADLDYIGRLKAELRPGGLLFVALPVGADAVIWNSGRIYSRARLPLLFTGWTFLAGFGFDPIAYDSGKPVMATFALSPNPVVTRIPARASAEQAKAVHKLIHSGAMDRPYYLKQYPDVLSGQMDAASHYILHGITEQRRPAPWLSHPERLKSFKDLDFSQSNPFARFS